MKTNRVLGKLRNRRIFSRWKKKDKTLEKHLIEMEVTALPYTLQNNSQNNWSLRSGHQHVKKVRISTKKHKIKENTKQKSEPKNTITGPKNTIESFNRRPD